MCGAVCWSGGGAAVLDFGLSSGFRPCLHHAHFSGHSSIRRAPHPHPSRRSLGFGCLGTTDLIRRRLHHHWLVTCAPSNRCPRSTCPSALRSRWRHAWARRTISSVPVRLGEEQLRTGKFAGRKVGMLERQEGWVRLVFCGRRRALVRVGVGKDCWNTAEDVADCWALLKVCCAALRTSPEDGRRSARFNQERVVRRVT